MAIEIRKVTMIFLDTDKHVSPFEVTTFIDLFPEAHVLLYSNVTPDDAKKIIQDAMFSRGCKNTKIFIGGSDVDRALEILEIAKKTMFPPFEMPIIIDPRGAYTTAAGAVGKIYMLMKKLGLGDFKDKNVAVLAGTGPVGIAATKIFALEEANVIVTSRSLSRAEAVATKINKEVGAERVKGVQASSPEEIGRAIENVEIVLATGAAGVQLLPLSILKDFGKKCKIVADVNAVPPLGIEGLKPKDDGKEIIPGVYGIGALPIGALKNRILEELFRKVVESRKGIFDFVSAYNIFKEVLAKELK